MPWPQQLHGFQPTHSRRRCVLSQSAWSRWAGDEHCLPPGHGTLQTRARVCVSTAGPAACVPVPPTPALCEQPRSPSRLEEWLLLGGALSPWPFPSVSSLPPSLASMPWKRGRKCRTSI